MVMFCDGFTRIGFNSGEGAGGGAERIVAAKNVLQQYRPAPPVSTDI